MAELIIHSNKIKENISYLSNYFETRNIEWSLVTKIFSGDEVFIKEIFTKDILKKINAVGDSRLFSLKYLRQVCPDLTTIYIKPPAEPYTDEIVKYADISLNTSFSTIKALNQSAKKNNITHKIIIMVELGDLREGVNNQDIFKLYKNTLNLTNIEVIGIGTNLGCLCGIEPTYNRLLQLSINKEQIAKKFNKEIKFLSGGTSITLPLIENASLPKGINHFRIGEAAFLGIVPVHNVKFKDLHTNTFEFYANIIELEEKTIVPDSINNNTDKRPTKSFRAILDFGLLDVDKKDIESEDNISFVGATSDMLVIDLGNNKTKSGKQKYKVGDKIKFKPNYMGVSRLLNSKFIDKIYI